MYRCQLMVEAGEVAKAVENLYHSFGEDVNQSADYGKLVGMIYKNKNKPAIFSLFHYSNVMRLLVETKHPDAVTMYKALTNFPAFADDLKNGDRKGHPWNLVVWNLSCCCRAFGKEDVSEKLFKKAMAITQANPDNVTMFTFSVSMAADNLLYCIRNDGKSRTAAENVYAKTCTALHRNKLPEKIAEAFPVPDGKPDKAELEKVAGKYLK